MEHIVEGHLGGYYISNREPEEIMEICEQCGDYDWIIVSYEEGKRFEALHEYFSTLKRNENVFLDNYMTSDDKQDIINDLVYEYEKDMHLIRALEDDGIISKEEMEKLLAQVSVTESKQYEVLKDVNFDEKKKLSKRKVYKNKNY